ncbi:MAG: hypothetical protein ACKESB_03865 [Candidatus Hodgkinia cicadicola]
MLHASGGRVGGRGDEGAENKEWANEGGREKKRKTAVLLDFSSAIIQLPLFNGESGRGGRGATLEGRGGRCVRRNPIATTTVWHLNTSHRLYLKVLSTRRHQLLR